MKKDILLLKEQGFRKTEIAKKLNITIDTVIYYYDDKKREERKVANLKRGKDCINQLKIEMGAKCSVCGYDKNLAALHFHHKNPNEKSFTIGMCVTKKGILSIRNEAKKCILLCANCHADVTWPISK